MTYLARCMAALGCLVAIANAARAEEVRRVISADALSRLGVPRNLALRDGAIELARGTVIEDDGPAAGYSYQPNLEKLKPALLIRKELPVPRPEAASAKVLVARGGNLQLKLNGQEVKLGPAQPSGNYWQVYDLDPKLLNAGANELIFSGEGQFWIARDDEYAAGSIDRTSHPNRSARSTDGGRTWHVSNLGTTGDIDGEYYVRLFLDQYAADGTLELPVIDLANLQQRPIAPSTEVPQQVSICLNVERPKGTQVMLSARTADTWHNATWSPWHALELAGDGTAKFEPSGKRYMQVRVRLNTSNPLASPKLKSVSVAAAAPSIAEDWSRDVTVTSEHAGPIVQSAIPFAYEPFDRPELAELRSKYKLDEVVGQATSEMELLSKLAAWSATRWEKTGHLSKIYPAWNALDILATHPDGSCVGGFCQQRSLVFLQACESFGIVGRIVSIGPGDRVKDYRGGHETVEIWSNRYAKWIHIDGDKGWYFIDDETREPLSLWELRQRQLDHLAGKSPRATSCVRIIEQDVRTWNSFADWPPFVELRLVPRSNFLQQRVPLPLNQGMRGWFWPGHYVWADDREPARPLYTHRVTRREDFEWDVNRTEIRLTATNQPGVLEVELATHTPGFAHFARLNDGDIPRPVADRFRWELKPGDNMLLVAAENQLGRVGVPATVRVRYGR